MKKRNKKKTEKINQCARHISIIAEFHARWHVIEWIKRQWRIHFNTVITIAYSWWKESCEKNCHFLSIEKINKNSMTYSMQKFTENNYGRLPLSFRSWWVGYELMTSVPFSWPPHQWCPYFTVEWDKKKRNWNCTFVHRQLVTQGRPFATNATQYPELYKYQLVFGPVRDLWNPPLPDEQSFWQPQRTWSEKGRELCSVIENVSTHFRLLKIDIDDG